MYYFIVNPNSRSGNGLKIWHQIRVELEKRNVIYEVHMTEYVGHGKKLAEKISALASSENHLHLVGMGGDGTNTEILSGLSNIEYITFGFIPTGSGNDFCRGMKLPVDPLKALDSILEEESVKLGKFQGHETIAYIDSIMSLYEAFCKICPRG